MKVRVFEEHTLLARTYKAIHEQRERGRLIQYIDVSKNELREIQQLLGLSDDYVPDFLHGVALRVEGIPAAEWKAYQVHQVSWEAAGYVAEGIIKKAQDQS